MVGEAVNRTVDRVIRDQQFAQQIRMQGVAAFQGLALTHDQAQQIARAVQQHADDAEMCAALSKLAHFEPLFASYSGTCTKKG